MTNEWMQWEISRGSTVGPEKVAETEIVLGHGDESGFTKRSGWGSFTTKRTLIRSYFPTSACPASKHRPALD